MPVAVPEVDGQLDPVGGELGLERGDQLAVLPVDRADAAEEVVVVADLGEPLRGMPRPRVTFSRNGITSSGPSGPPNETTMSAS